MTLVDWRNEQSSPRVRSHHSNQAAERGTDYAQSAHRRERSQAKLMAFYEPIGPPVIVAPNDWSASPQTQDIRKTASAERGFALMNMVKAKDQHLSSASSRKSRPRLDFSQLFTTARAPQGSLLSPSKVSHSPTAMTDVSEAIPGLLRSHTIGGRQSSAPPRVPSSKSTSTRSQPLERDMQTKTHVRRPPKGIQNWFDAFPSSDEEECEVPRPKTGHFELPTHELPYRERRTSMSVRDTMTQFPSILSQRVSRSPRDSRATVQIHSQQSMLSSPSSRLNSLSISQTGLSSIRGDPEAEYEDARAVEISPAHPARILDTGSNVAPSGISFEATASHTSSRHRSRSAHGQEDSYSASRNYERNLRRLHNLSMASKATGTTFQDVTPHTPTSAAHIMAVTEEEKALLDMMRQKRAAMQQISFTEGYQTGLRRAQPERRRSGPTSQPSSINDEERYTSHSDGSTQPTSYGDNELRRQLSLIRKQGVDEVLKLERYLRNQESFSNPPVMPMELPGSKTLRRSQSAAVRSHDRHLSTPPPFLPGEYVHDTQTDTDAPREKRASRRQKEARRRSKSTAQSPSHSIDQDPVAFQTFQRNTSKVDQGKPRLKERSNLHNDLSTALLNPGSSQIRSPEQISPYKPLPAEPARQVSRSVYEDRKTLQLLTNSSAVVSPHGSDIAPSPFSSLISAAAAPSQSSSQQTARDERATPTLLVTPTVEEPVAAQGIELDAPAARRKKSRMDLHGLGQAQVQVRPRSVNSASEEILAAWADLGGFRDS